MFLFSLLLADATPANTLPCCTIGSHCAQKSPPVFVVVATARRSYDGGHQMLRRPPPAVRRRLRPTTTCAASRDDNRKAASADTRSCNRRHEMLQPSRRGVGTMTWRCWNRDMAMMEPAISCAGTSVRPCYNICNRLRHVSGLAVEKAATTHGTTTTEAATGHG